MGRLHLDIDITGKHSLSKDVLLVNKMLYCYTPLGAGSFAGTLNTKIRLSLGS
jgi:hypothetical protein